MILQQHLQELPIKKFYDLTITFTGITHQKFYDLTITFKGVIHQNCYCDICTETQKHDYFENKIVLYFGRFFTYQITNIMEITLYINLTLTLTP